MIQITNKPLLEETPDAIAHLCDCTSSMATGNAWKIFNKYPYGNTFHDRQNGNFSKSTGWHMPGDIQVRTGQGPYIINMLAQYFPGMPGRDQWDTQETRANYIFSCYSKLLNIPNIKYISIPYNMFPYDQEVNKRYIEGLKIVEKGMLLQDKYVITLHTKIENVDGVL